MEQLRRLRGHLGTGRQHPLHEKARRRHDDDVGDVDGGRPHVVGGAALYLSSHTTASPGAVETALRSAATTTSKKSKDGRTIIREYVGGF